MANGQHRAEFLAVRERLKRATVPIVEEAPQQVYVGAGVFYAVEDRRFLITAEHVGASLVNGTVAVAISDTNSELWTPGPGTLAKATSHDVAVMELRDRSFIERVERTGYRQFLDANDVYQGRLPTDLGVYGYPAAQTSHTVDNINSEPIFIHTNVYNGRITGLTRERTEHDIFLAWPPELESSLAGISGAPIWAFTETDEGLWAPSGAARICGVETSALQGTWIRGTQWAIVEAAIQRLGNNTEPENGPSK